jgi:hypothetical protein
MINLIKSLLDKRNLRLIKNRSQRIKHNIEAYQGEKLIRLNNGKRFCLVHSQEDTLGIIYVVSNKGFSGRLIYIINSADQSIKIGNILFKPINTGIGTELLKYLDEIAIDGNYKYMTGWISPVDFDHLDKLFHFYKKNGFKIEKNNGRMGGYIINKKLSLA